MLPMVQEAIEQLHAVTVLAGDVLELFFLLLGLVVLLERLEPLGLHPVAGNLVKDLDFVEGSIEVVRG